MLYSAESLLQRNREERVRKCFMIINELYSLRGGTYIEVTLFLIKFHSKQFGWFVLSSVMGNKPVLRLNTPMIDPSSFLFCNKSVLSCTALCVTHDSRLVSQFQASDKTLSNRKAVLMLHILGEEMSIN